MNRDDYLLMIAKMAAKDATALTDMVEFLAEKQDFVCEEKAILLKYIVVFRELEEDLKKLGYSYKIDSQHDKSELDWKRTGGF